MSQRYRPLYKLDAGGMAEVYVAEAVSMAGFSKKVAIKRILPGLIKDQRFVRMFLDEARISLRLNHANIVSVFDIGESESTYFIVMEFVEGTNLKTMLEHAAKRQQTLPIQLTCWIVNEILKGLEYAHRLTDNETGAPMGIVHRDISPPNILVSWNGEVKLTDFGLAKATTQLESTDPGVVKGKYSYLSPEAAHAQAVDHRSDVFAVGILAFEMLTGRRLFKGKNDFQTIAMVRQAEVPSIRSFNKDIPKELEKIIMKALTKDVSQRYQSADEFSHDLLSFLFSKRMMVGARDVIEWVKPIREERDKEIAAQRQQAEKEVSPGGTNLFLDLIQEEMMHFRSIGEGEGPAGAKPVVAAGSMIPPAQMGAPDPSKPIDIGAFSPGSGTLGLSPTPTPVPGPGNIPSMADALGLDLPVVGRPKEQEKEGGSPVRPRAGNGAGGPRAAGAESKPKLPPSLAPPMPTVAESSSSPLLYIIVALVGVAGVVIYFVISGG
ncbi:MAG: serine/threonine protein kinase [Myxococcales bacterium]|nr:serine/threonine protein kinase [Myxococcales bacterium]MCB9700346.1 serine/threonine protein kinase [Myxococcales bacterium]